MSRIHHRTCHLCEAMCGVAIEVDGDRIVTIRGDRDDPFSQGHICPKAMGLKDVHEDPDRLKVPQRRAGDRWEPVGWDEALADVAEQLDAVQRRHGRDSVALYLGNPTVHNHGATLFGVLLSKALGSRNRYSATSVDQLPQMLASLLMFGHQLLLPIPDIDRTSFFLVLGANPLVSGGSIMTAPGVERRMADIRARGGRVVVVDPRRTETAQKADQHLFIRPGTDALLLAAMLSTIFEEGLARPGRLAQITDGLEVLEREVKRFHPEAVARPTGIEAPQIRALAREFAAAPRAVCYGRVGVCTQRFGGLACWLVNAMNLVTGNLDREGGAMFPTPAIDLVGLASQLGQAGHFDRGRSRVRGLPEFGGEYPVATLADEIDTPGRGQVRALITLAGNPVLSAPNGKRLDRALPKLDFMVSVDIYRNETTRHAKYILPPTFALERDHYDLVFHALAVRNTAKYSPPLFEPSPGARHDWQILLELSTRLEAQRGPGARASSMATRALLGALGPERLLDLGLRAGPYGAGPIPLGSKRGGLTLASLKASPHGVDLGPLRRSLPERLPGRRRRIDAAPARMLGDLPRLAELLGGAARGPAGLELIGRRELRSNNSWMHNAERLVKGPERCTLKMNPHDAARRGLEKGQRVRVRSRAGEVLATLEITDELMAGVVSLPHGWGHHRPGTALRVASQRPGVSVNDVTDETDLDTLSGVAALSGVEVQVEPAS